MKNIIKSILLVTLTAVGFAACGGGTETEGPQNNKLELSTSSDEIGIGETVTFTVKFNGNTVTDGIEIKNLSTNETLTGSSFTADKAGTFRFSATYNEATSNVKTITVTSVSKLELIPDKDSFIAGKGEVVFTVKYEGEDVTGEASIRNLTDNAELEDNKFTSTVAGEYDFVATYNDETSKTVTIEVEAVGLRLVADQPDIVANGIDVVRFTVLNNGKDITATSGVKVVNKGDNNPLTVKDGAFEFTSTTVGSESFAAEYEDMESDPVTITVEAVRTDPFYKRVMLAKYTHINCGPCTFYEYKIQEVIESVGDKLIQMVIHTQNLKGVIDPYFFPQIGQTTSFFGVTAEYIPDGTFDKRERVNNAAYPDAIISMVNNLAGYPATSGFKATSKIVDGTVTVDVAVKASSEDRFYLGVAVLEDLIGRQISGDGWDEEWHHHDTLRQMATQMSGDDLGTIPAGMKVRRSYTFELNNEIVAANAKIMLYTVHVDGGLTVINNAVHVPINGSVDYEY